jgi:hypothetical protein
MQTIFRGESHSHPTTSDRRLGETIDESLTSRDTEILDIGGRLLKGAHVITDGVCGHLRGRVVHPISGRRFEVDGIYDHDVIDEVYRTAVHGYMRTGAPTLHCAWQTTKGYKDKDLGPILSNTYIQRHRNQYSINGITIVDGVVGSQSRDITPEHAKKLIKATKAKIMRQDGRTLRKLRRIHGESLGLEVDHV